MTDWENPSADDFLVSADFGATSEAQRGSTDRPKFVAEMRRAMQHQQAGRLAEAAEAYERALSHHPDQPDALNYSGYLAHQLGDSQRGLALIERSLALEPENPVFIANMAKVQQALGQLEEAAACYRRALAVKPDDAKLNFNLGVLLVDLGRQEEAAGCFQRSIELDPQDARALVNLGNLFQRAGRMKKALRLYRRAVEADPRDSTAQNNLAAMHRALGRPDKAAQWYRRSLSTNPEDARAQCELGALLADRGRMEEAVAAYRQALALDPTLSKAHLYLSATKRFTPGDSDLAAMERLLADATMPPMDQAELHFALGKARQDLADFDEAFAHFSKGNGLQRSSVNVDLDVIEREVQASLEAFDRALIERHQERGSESRLPLFLIGPAGAGLPLVEAVLGQHSAVHAGGALRHLTRFALGLPQRLGLDAGYPQVTGMIEPSGWRALAETYLEELSPINPDARHIVDRRPGNFQHLGLVHLLFPQAIIVQVSRDPLDACLASYQTLSSDSFEFALDLSELGRFHRLYERAMEQWRQVLPDRVLELSYESLLEEPEESVRRLLDRCGLTWEQACLRPLQDHVRPLPACGPAGLAAPYAAHLEALRASLQR